MKKSKLLIIVFMLVFALAMPTAVFANYAEESYVYDYVVGSVVVVAEPADVENGAQNMVVLSTVGGSHDPSEWLEEISRTCEDSGIVYVRLRAFAEMNGARTINWDPQLRAALITLMNGVVHPVIIEEVGGLIEYGVSWIPMEVAEELGQIIIDAWVTPAPRVDRIDLTLWERERFEDVRDTTFSTELPHGQISVNYIEYMSDNLCARSAFTYRELEAAIWIVEELLAMGHDWDNITAQEFTYWDVREEGVGRFLSWWNVMSEMILGVDRDYQLRADRVSQNVILTIPGQSERKIIVGAHYDSPPYPSASDNASGTALLLESAQRMLDIDNYHTIVYVFFGAEEVGLIGAYWYYEMLTEAQRENIVMMINADVLIEGPYIIYGATGAPEIDEADLPAILEAMAEMMFESWFQMFYEMLSQDEETRTIALYDGRSIEELLEDEGKTLEELVEMMVENSIAHLQTLPAAQFAMQAGMMGLLDAKLTDEVQQINSIAAELNRAYDLGILSIVDATRVSSDQLVFLFEGHTVVQFVGLERMGNLEAVLGEHYDSIFPWPIFEDFVATILHSPLDEFHTIESIWPGMMLNNMRAFSKLLEGILTASF